MALEPGTLDNSGNFINPDCMAKDIEDVLTVLLPPPQPSATLTQDILDNIKHQQRLFLISISSGIINYLKKHDHDSFSVTTKISGTNHIGTLDIQ
jgi:hypothetical protein